MRRFVLIFGFALLAAACGGEQISEQLAEQAIGGNADVQISGDGDDVTINIESDEGSISIGSCAELPDSLAVPVPDGGDVMSSFSDTNSAGASIMYPGDRYDEIVTFYESWTAGTGGDWQNSTSTFELDGQTQRTSQWNNEGNQYFILVADCIDIGTGEHTSTCVTINENL